MNSSDDRSRSKTLLAFLEVEIADLERHLESWRRQMQHESGTELEAYSRRIIAGYDVQLAQLQTARKLVAARELFDA